MSPLQAFVHNTEPRPLTRCEKIIITAPAWVGVLAILGVIAVQVHQRW